MSQITIEGLQHEWEFLHGNHESYERLSLGIKLTAVVLTFGALALNFEPSLGIAFILALWLQDGIWKTYQARIGARLVVIETQLRAAYREAGAQYQLYSQWQENRGGAATLILEYLRSAIRPTTAYPYALLVVIMILFGLTET